MSTIRTTIRTGQLKALSCIVPAYIFPGLQKDFQSQVKRKKTSATAILERISYVTAIPTEFITGKSRKREYVEARHIAMFITLQRTDLSLQKIGQMYGRDHSTVCHARDTIMDRLEVEPKFRKFFHSIESQV